MKTMLFSDVKNHELFSSINSVFQQTDFYSRKMPLLKMLVILSGESFSNKFDLFTKTGSIERHLDFYFTHVYKGEKLHKEEVDYMKCCMDIILSYEENKFLIDEFITILTSFVPSKQIIFKSCGSDVSFLGSEKE